MKFLIFADPLDRLKAETDTSLAILRASIARKHKVYWATAEQLRFESGKLRVEATACASCATDKLPQRAETEDRPLTDFSVVWIRNDPPFDDSYVALCWLLALEEDKLLFINKPTLLLRYHEKLIPFEAVAQGFLKPADVIPTHIGNWSSARAFIDRSKISTVIRKPFFGYAGSEVHRFSGSDSSPPSEKGLQLTQAFLPEIAKEGDRRVFFLGGKRIGDFVRLPKSGDFVSNLARGGSAHLMTMTAAQQAVADKLGAFLKSVGIVFAGADFIGKRVSEVNITSPTGVRTFAKLTGLDLSEMLVRYAERKAE